MSSTHVTLRLNQTPTRRIAETSSVCPICTETITEGSPMLGVGFHREVRKDEWIHPTCFHTLKTSSRVVRRYKKSVILLIPKLLLPADIIAQAENLPSEQQPQNEFSF